MGKVFVSVIIPIYNMEKYIRQCVYSIQSQSLKDIEILCINDGSTDGSIKIIEEMALEDKRIRIITQEHKGVAEARNTGIDLASGDYLSILDADDFFEENMLENAFKRASSCEADICMFQSKRYIDGKIEVVSNSVRTEWIPKKVFCALDVKDRIFSLGPLWAWDKLYKRELIQNNNIKFQNLRSTNDARFVCIAFVLAKRICVCENAFAIHRIGRKDSLSSTREKSWDCFYKAIESTSETLKELNLYDTYVHALRNWILEFSIWNLMTLSYTVQGAVLDLIVNNIFPQYEILKYTPDYYLLPDLYDKAIKMSQTQFLEELRKTPKEMLDLSEEIRDYSNIVIYGAGRWGVEIYDKIMKEKKGVSILWVDKNWKRIANEKITIRDPKEIRNFSYDRIVIAVENRTSIAEIKAFLIQLSVKEEMIISRC